jgi:LysM repeat protein
MTTTMGQRLKGRTVLMLIGVVILVTAGCVTKETYQQQVNRTTNLQRLLAEEEKRNSDLSTEVTRLKRQTSDVEAQNKLLSDQLRDARAQVVRSLEEVGKLQEEVQAARKSSKSKRAAAAPAPTEPPDRLDELQFETPSTAKKPAQASSRIIEDTVGATYHDVKRGDTLFNIAKRYKTDVKTLKELNALDSDEIELGMRLQIRK